MQSHEDTARHEGIDSSEGSLARLLKLSGRRGMPSADASERAHAAALAAWQGSLEEARLRRRRRIWQMAAVVVLAVIGAATWMALSLRDAQVVTIARVVVAADAALLVSGATTSAVTPGAHIRAGTQLRTQNGRVSLRIGESLSLRVDAESHVGFEAENRIALMAGAVYVDSGALGLGSDLLILTPAGEVRHFGTQFQVVVAGRATQIHVREGRVQLRGGEAAEPVDVVAGEAISIDAQGGISRRAIASYGAAWDWVSAMATPIDVENRPLAEFLAWLVREHGWQLRYASAAEERAAQTIRLHGALQGRTPLDTLERVSLVTGLEMRVENGVLLVGALAGASP